MAKTLEINNGKVVFNIDGNTQHFTLDAGSEVVYFAMHHFSFNEIVEAFKIAPESERLLRYLPGYQPNLIESKEKDKCPTCLRAY